MTTITQDELKRAVNTFFDQRKWLYKKPERDLYLGTMRVRAASVAQVDFSLRIVPSGFINVCTVPMELSDEKLSRVAEYLHRVNSQLLRGCFELDYQRRKCCYKMVSMTSFMSDVARLNGLVEELFLVPGEMIEIFSEGIREVQDGAEPMAIVDRIMKPFRSGT